MTDPLDSVVPSEARWEAFRRQFASALLLEWFFAELPEVAPDYAADLHGRLEQAFLSYPDIFRREGDYDGWVPVQGPGDSLNNVWMPEEDAVALHDALFPHGLREVDLPGTGRALTLVAMHGALELYSLGVGAKRGPSLPDALRKLLVMRGADRQLDSRTFDDLVEFDALRHIIVHNAGVVDNKYDKKTRSSPLLVGERRAISSEDLHRMGSAANRVARLLRTIDS